MTDKAVTTQDDASASASRSVTMVDVDHEGVSGSVHLTVGVAQLTQSESQISATCAPFGDGLFDSHSPVGSGASLTGAWAGPRPSELRPRDLQPPMSVANSGMG